MTCANCGYQTTRAPDGSDYYCIVCGQSAVGLVAVLPGGETMPELKALPVKLRIAPDLFSKGHTILQWYDGENYQAIHITLTKPLNAEALLQALEQNGS